MWRSKKFIIPVIVVVVLGAVLGGVAIAQADDEDSGQVTVVKDNILDKVAEIYEKNTGTAIDPEQLQKAFDEARQAIADEAMDNYLNKLVEDGKITQEQADQYKAWLDAKPALPTEEFKNWMESRPDVPCLFGERFRGMMPFDGIKGALGKIRMRIGGGPGEWCPMPDQLEFSVN